MPLETEKERRLLPSLSAREAHSTGSKVGAKGGASSLETIPTAQVHTGND
jgi:hypothetical protein